MKVARQVNVHEAKTQLSKLLVEVERGAEIIVARDGKPVAKLVPVGPSSASRQLGQGKGSIAISPDFDGPMSDDELKGWGL